jgi:hypothetical protein
MAQVRPGKGTKRHQMLRAAREIKRQKREEQQRREEEVELPEELLARVDVDSEEELDLPENPRQEGVGLPQDLESDDSDFEEESDCEVTDSEEECAVVDKSALETLMECSRQIGYDAFEDNTTVFMCSQVLCSTELCIFVEWVTNRPSLRLELGIHGLYQSLLQLLCTYYGSIY